jgi:HSP20 family protein
MKVFGYLLMATVLGIAAGLGCSSEETAQQPDQGDRTPPELVGSFPTDGAVDVSRSGPYWLAFSEAMDDGSIEDNIDVSVADDRITIRGEKREEEERKERGYYRLERSYGSFQRSFYLPCEVEADRVDASFKDGVLTVKLPKSAAARERIMKIPVRTG